MGHRTVHENVPSQTDDEQVAKFNKKCSHAKGMFRQI